MCYRKKHYRTKKMLNINIHIYIEMCPFVYVRGEGVMARGHLYVREILYTIQYNNFISIKQSLFTAIRINIKCEHIFVRERDHTYIVVIIKKYCRTKKMLNMNIHIYIEMSVFVCVGGVIARGYWYMRDPIYIVVIIKKYYRTKKMLNMNIHIYIEMSVFVCARGGGGNNTWLLVHERPYIHSCYHILSEECSTLSRFDMACLRHGVKESPC